LAIDITRKYETKMTGSGTLAIVGRRGFAMAELKSHLQ
jgi:hypothetical protein